MCSLISAAGLVAAGLVVAAPASAVAPDNDLFSAAAPIVAAVTQTADNSDATLEPDEPQPSCALVANSIWYSFIPQADGTFTVQTMDTSVDTVLAVYQGATLSGLTPVACNDQASAYTDTSSLTTQLTGGTTYAVQVSSRAQAEGGPAKSTGSITTRIVVSPPINDEPYSLPWLDQGAQVTEYTNGATTSKIDNDWGPPNGCNGQASVWFFAVDGVDFQHGLSLDTSGTSFDSELLVVEGNPFSGDVTHAWCATAGGTGDDARLQIPTSGAHGYYIRVASQDGATGTLHLSAFDAVVPNAPRDVHAVPGDRSAQVSWTAATSEGPPITGYKITTYRVPGWWAPVSTTVASSATIATVTGLTNGRHYAFVVQAVNPAGDSQPSTSSNFLTPAGVPPRMPAPKVTVRGRTAIVTWRAADLNGARHMKGYEVDISKGRDQTRRGHSRQAVFVNLSPGRYRVRIAARNQVGLAPYSRWTWFRIR